MAANQEDLKGYFRRLRGNQESNGPELPPDVPAAYLEQTRSALAKLNAGGGGEPLTAAEQFATEAIILPGRRPAVRIEKNGYSITHPDWAAFDRDPFKGKLLGMLPSVGRIDLPSHPAMPFAGTGFVVGNGLLMTNRHVAALFASGLGLKELLFQSGAGIGVDFRREIPQEPAALLMIRDVILIHPYWDMALLKFDAPGGAPGPLDLSGTPVGKLGSRPVAVIGYPAFNPLVDADVQNLVFERLYNVKRLLPGYLRGRMPVESFGHDVSALTHDGSTQGGSSGSAVCDPSTGEVVALHFGGIYLKTNYAVPMAELAQDERIVKTGVRFRGSGQPAVTSWDSYWTKALPPETEERSATPAAPPAPVPGDGATTVKIPLEITIRLGPGGSGSSVIVAPAQGGAPDLERAVEPLHDAPAISRAGYEEAFLGPIVPLPIADPAHAALAINGEPVLRYHHFSLAMHARRRLALYVASNLEFSEALRAPEGGRDYTRQGLTGLGDSDREKWFPDTRIDAEYQLTERFFKKAPGVFDRGHLVRREDVAWGPSYAHIQSANGDTFHLTNCSPQVKEFNRANLAETNWGRLENDIAKQARSERVSLLAGPILHPKDPVFVGVDEHGPLRMQIPERFWKVVLVAAEGALQSFAFVLEQDLTQTPLEYTLSAAWQRHNVPVAVLEKELHLRFPRIVHESDQFGTGAGTRVREEMIARKLALTPPSPPAQPSGPD